MRKKIGFIFILIFSFGYVVVVFLIDGIAYSSFITLFTILGALSVYFYNNSVTIYRWWNEALNKYKRKPQITWISNYTVASMGEESFETAKRELIRILEDQDKFNSLKYLDDTENTFRVQIETPAIKQFNIDKTSVQEEISEFDFSYKTTLSYAESKNEFDKALVFFNEICNKLPLCHDDNDEILIKSPTYNVRISIDNMNPFYGLVTRKIDKERVENVSLKFNYGKAEIETNDNLLIITSTNLEEIKKATKEYIALTNTI